jgi:hypothetical protein
MLWLILKKKNFKTLQSPIQSPGKSRGANAVTVSG